MGIPKLELWHATLTDVATLLHFVTHGGANNRHSAILVKKFPAFDETRKLFNVCTRTNPILNQMNLA
jgi:hypothetical protein